MNIMDARRYARNKQIRRERMIEARRKGTHTPAEWSALVAEFDGRCVKCLSEDNLQPLCPYCNTGKGPENFNWVQFRRAQK